jgi:hypothetical protein
LFRDQLIRSNHNQIRTLEQEHVMPFETGQNLENEYAKKDESQLSQHPSAVRARTRRAREVEAQARREANAAAKEVAAKDAKRAAMVTQFGVARVRAWESLRYAGVIVQDLLNFFFNGGATTTTDETVEEVIELLAKALDGCEPDKDMPETEWDRFRVDVREAARLGFDINVTAANCREFFTYYLKERRGEIVGNDLERRPWWPEPVSVQELAPESSEPKSEVQAYATTPPAPPAPRPTISMELQDALTHALAAIENRRLNQ